MYYLSYILAFGCYTIGLKVVTEYGISDPTLIYLIISMVFGTVNLVEGICEQLGSRKCNL